MSSSLVAQFDTEMRIAAMPCHVVPAIQHVPSFCAFTITARGAFAERFGAEGFEGGGGA